MPKKKDRDTVIEEILFNSNDTFPDSKTQLKQFSHNYNSSYFEQQIEQLNILQSKKYEKKGKKKQTII